MVLQVRKKETGAIYALKILDKRNVLKEEMTVKQTMFERKVLEMVNHPFVVKLQFAYQTKGCLCLVMDFVNGGELFSHLAKAGTFSEDNTRLWSAEILLALEYLHNMGTIWHLVFSHS
jgi:serum/glucocorticoid-regulated kinase 2